jgi:hypothetical protein
MYVYLEGGECDITTMKSCSRIMSGVRMACQPTFASQMISRSIYSPCSSRRKKKLFHLNKKALLHSKREYEDNGKLVDFSWLPIRIEHF